MVLDGLNVLNGCKFPPCVSIKKPPKMKMTVKASYFVGEVVLFKVITTAMVCVDKGSAFALVPP